MKHNIFKRFHQNFNFCEQIIRREKKPRNCWKTFSILLSISTWSISPAVIKNQLLAIVWVMKHFFGNIFLNWCYATNFLVLYPYTFLWPMTPNGNNNKIEAKFVFLSHLRNLQRDVCMHTLRKLSLMSEYWNFVSTSSTLHRHEYMKNRMRRRR